jgi:hypothetical protein
LHHHLNKDVPLKLYGECAVTDVKNTAQEKYSSAHDAIISSPTYAQLYSATLNYAKWAWGLPIVHKPAEMLYSTAYPKLKGVVDPVVGTVEPYVKALEEHLEPKAISSPPAGSNPLQRACSTPLGSSL